MRRIISALILGVAACLGPVSAEEAIALAENAPDSHTVVRGDTLWSISGQFLKQPWRWPELWGMNRSQVRNPHRIYPGDIIVLDRSGVKPRLRLGRKLNSRRQVNTSSGIVRLEPQIYSEQTQEAISSIPANVIEPFISRPLVVEENELATAPVIVALQEDRVFLGNGDRFFVTGISDDSQRDWYIYRKARPLTDPETNSTLGHEAYYLGTARLKSLGETATFQITALKEEITRGDLMLPAPPPTLMAYVPHHPDSEVSARVMSIYGGVGEAGKYSIIAVNKGESDGLEPGHVLALYRSRIDRSSDFDGKKQEVAIPDEEYGLIFVFRTFQRIAYALVMNTTRTVQTNDRALSPR